MKSNHLVLESAEFSMFTTEEIKKLCVLKITTPLTFDSLGYPIQGGLYDTSLGMLLFIPFLITIKRNCY